MEVNILHTECDKDVDDIIIKQERPSPELRKTGVYAYKCNFKGCEKPFKAKKSLIDHVRIHKGERPFICYLPTCQKSFTQYSSLQKHERIHKGERPYVCKRCAQSFTQVSNLKRHERLHTGEKPHACEHCPKKFSTSSNLKQHTQIHQIQQSRSKYCCETCGKNYFYNSSLKKHLREHAKASATGIKQHEDDSLTETGKQISLPPKSNPPDTISTTNTNPSPSPLQTPQTISIPVFNPVPIQTPTPTPTPERKSGPVLVNTSSDYANILNPSYVPPAINTAELQKTILSLRQDLWRDNLRLEQLYRDLIPTNPVHIHPHFHSERCEHPQIIHDDHIDYLHDNQLCHQRPDGSIVIHQLEESEKNPVCCKPLTGISHCSSDFAILGQYKLMMDLLLTQSSPACCCSHHSPFNHMAKLNNLFTTKSVVNLLSEESMGCANPHCSARSNSLNLHQNPFHSGMGLIQQPLNNKILAHDHECCGNKTSRFDEDSDRKKSDIFKIHRNAKDSKDAKEIKESEEGYTCPGKPVNNHKHGNDCGHSAIVHHGHIDYIVEGRLHHVHGDHCDDHGLVSFAKKKRTISDHMGGIIE